MPGPAPKANPAHRIARVGLRRLPPEGRKGPTPPWPLSNGQTPPERDLWRQLWHSPQSAAWEEMGWTRVVARYCRVLLAAEQLDKDAMSEARQLEDRLGLTPKAMRMLLWEIARDEVADRRVEKKSNQPTARERIKAVG